MKFEFRDWSYLDSYKVNMDRLGQGGEERTGITNLVQADIGYSFIF